MKVVPIAETRAETGAAAHEFRDLADPMAPVDDLLPPEAIAPTTTRAPQPASTPRDSEEGEEVVPPAPQFSGARSLGYGVAIRRRRGQERLLVGLMALLVLAAAAMAVGYVTGFIRFGAPSQVAVNGEGASDPVSDIATANGKSGKGGDDSAETDTTRHDSNTSKTGDGSTETVKPVEAVKTNGSNESQGTNHTTTNTSTNSAKTEIPSDTPPADPAQVAKFQGTLAAARAALGRRDFTDAKARIEQAKRLTVTDDQNNMADGFESLAGYVEGFWEAVREGTEGLESVGELTIGSTPVSIVEVGQKHLIIRTAGQNRRYALDKLPAGLAVAIAKRWFDERADNKVILGAFHFVDPRTNVADAKRLWEEAAAAGVDVKRLLSLLPIAEVKEPTDESEKQ
jgi:hypothetical protein